VGYPLSVVRPGFAEQEPERWRRASLAALRAAGAAEGARVRGIGLTGQMHGAVLLGKDQQPLRPAILWCDQRCER
jgi:xylulokinase